MSEIVHTGNQALEQQGQRVPATHVVDKLLEVIEANPTAGADNIKALLDGMERVAKLQAEQQFIAAFSRLKFPPIVKNRKAHSSKYAAFEDIQAVIDPILAEQGFTLTYSSGEPNEKGEVPTFGKLSHIGGHSERGLIYLPPDGIGTKSGGMNMNALQGRGSATAYGQRYVAKMMLNLRFIGDDDDAGGAKTITEAQARELDNLVMVSDANLAKFLETYGVKSIRELYAVNFAAAKMLLEQRYDLKLRRERGEI